MKIVVFGLTISSSWGNGHAKLWRALAAGLARERHELVFFERDVPYFAAHRDCAVLRGGRIHLYTEWAHAKKIARRELGDASAAIVTSYCPDGADACELVLTSPACVRAFYDMDTPVTLARLRSGVRTSYLPPDGLAPFDLVLSFTGGRALDALRDELGARWVEPLYGSVDPDVHRPVASGHEFAGDFSYLGTYSNDRHRALDSLFLDAADRLPEHRFLMAGERYPAAFPWRANIFYLHHLAPHLHSAFYCGSPITLNVTRTPLVEMGYCPSRRLFEAACCGAAVLSDAWDGLDLFFEPDREVLIARTTEDAVRIVSQPLEVLTEIGRAARARTLREHTGWHRARELVELLENSALRAATMYAKGA